MVLWAVILQLLATVATLAMIMLLLLFAAVVVGITVEPPNKGAGSLCPL